MSVSRLDKPPTLRPAQDPDRREILIIAGLTAHDYRASTVVYELSRNRKGEVREVKALESADVPIKVVENSLLDALFFGFAMGLFQNPN